MTGLQKINSEITKTENTKENFCEITYKLPVDIYETDKEFFLLADMPGVDFNNITVDVHEGKLRIEGKVKVDEYDGLTPVYTEYNLGNYYREFFINENIATSNISATLTEGTLKVTLPKIDSAITRKIVVKAE